MTGCMAELFFWSLGNNVCIPDHVIGCHSYHDKEQKVSNPEHPYLEERQLFADSQDITWTPRNKRPDRLRDTLKDVEALLTQYKCVKTNWRSRTVLQTVLSNGCLISYQLKSNADIEKLIIDKSLIGKLSSQFISDAVLTKSFFLFSYPDCAKLDYIYFQKTPSTGDDIKKLEKISSWDPKIYRLHIPGPTTRRVSRHLCYCSNSDLLLAWWSLNPEDACPWSPLASEKEEANLILLALSGPHLEVVSFVKTEYSLLQANFSRCHMQQILTIELVSSRSGEATVEVATYQILSARMQRRNNAVSLVLPSMVSCYCVHPTQNKILFGCFDGTLFMFDQLGLTTCSTQANITASCMAWHTNGSVVFIASSSGNIQIFDLALNHLRLQLVGENLSLDKILKTEPFFRNTTLLQDIQWNSISECEDTVGDPHFLLLIYKRGPLAVLRLYLGLINSEGLSVLELIKEYLKHSQLSQATSLLCSLRWDIDGPSCYAGLSAIVNYLLRQPLNAERESYLEKALGMFYSPKESLTDAVILEYRDPICRLARRFFHLLLRYSRFDKAFLLAVDIGSEDLFMDIHYAALDCKETGLAEVAKKKAEEIRDTYVNTSDDDYDSQESADPELYSYDDDCSAKSGSLGNAYHNRLKRSSSLRKNATSSRDPLDMKRHYTKEKLYKDVDTRLDGYSREVSDLPDNQSEYSNDDIGHKLANELIQDYTAALMDSPPHEGNNGHVLTYL